MNAEAYPETPAAALAALQAGNKRHQAGTQELRNLSPLGERHADGQRPFAAIISCADSRVSTALAFDLDRGNLFVSKVAGNTLDRGTLGSTEFAVAVLGVTLVMVLGHTDCGAVKAAIEVANGTRTYPPDTYGAIGPVVDAVVPAVKALPANQRALPACVAANARAQAAEIARKAPIIRPAVEAGTLSVVAAVYEVEAGRVELL
jgi:carbonic anhydrase